MADQSTVTQLLVKAQAGQEEAVQAIFPLVYDELRRLAHHRRQQWRGDYTINTTALVHEAYLKLIDLPQEAWRSRAHFLGVASKAMRHILIDYAKQRRAEKRGGDKKKVSFEEIEGVLGGAIPMNSAQAEMLLGLDEALERLARVSERQHRIVECRFFAGMTIEDTAAALDISPATVKRGWAMAQAWLHREMRAA